MITLPFYRNDAIGAHGRAERAADALIGLRAHGGMMALGVEFRFVKFDDLLGARVHAQTAAFAAFLSESNLCQIVHLRLSEYGPIVSEMKFYGDKGVIPRGDAFDRGGRDDGKTRYLG